MKGKSNNFLQLKRIHGTEDYTPGDSQNGYGNEKPNEDLSELKDFLLIQNTNAKIFSLLMSCSWIEEYLCQLRLRRKQMTLIFLCAYHEKSKAYHFAEQDIKLHVFFVLWFPVYFSDSIDDQTYTHQVYLLTYAQYNHVIYNKANKTKKKVTGQRLLHALLHGQIDSVLGSISQCYQNPFFCCDFLVFVKWQCSNRTFYHSSAIERQKNGLTIYYYL